MSCKGLADLKKVFEYVKDFHNDKYNSVSYFDDTIADTSKLENELNLEYENRKQELKDKVINYVKSNKEWTENHCSVNEKNFIKITNDFTNTYFKKCFEEKSKSFKEALEQMKITIQVL